MGRLKQGSEAICPGTHSRSTLKLGRALSSFGCNSANQSGAVTKATQGRDPPRARCWENEVSRKQRSPRAQPTRAGILLRGWTSCTATHTQVHMCTHTPQTHMSHTAHTLHTQPHPPPHTHTPHTHTHTQPHTPHTTHTQPPPPRTYTHTRHTPHTTTYHTHTPHTYTHITHHTHTRHTPHIPHTHATHTKNTPPPPTHTCLVEQKRRETELVL